MNARTIWKSLALALVVASSLGLGGCTQRLIIEESVPEETTGNDPHVRTVDSDENGGAVANQALYVRSGQAEVGEQESGPFPQPWQSRLGPFPQPWQRDGDDSDDGKSPPPPSDPNPNPDPNPKP